MSGVVSWASLPSAVDSYAAYVRAVEDIPPLEEDEERRLANVYRGNGDLAAAHKLAVSHLRLVVAVARGYAGYGLDAGDLVQEGNMGLLKAVKKFDPDRGARLATFAVYWIRAEIHNFVLRNWRIVKVATTKAQRKLFFNMRRLFERDDDGNIKHADQLADDLGVRGEDVRDMRERVKNTNQVVFSASDENGEPAGAELVLEASAEASDPESLLIAQQEDATSELTVALNSLNERDREIIQLRRLSEPPATLQTLADRFGVSAERIRQLESAALLKLRRGMEAQGRLHAGNA